MNIETYDQIADGINEYFAIFLWFVFLYVCFVAPIGIAWHILNNVWPNFFPARQWSWILGGCLFPSLLLAFFVYAMRKARRRFGSCLWRDFWMAWGHSVIIENVKSDKQEALKQEWMGWIKENKVSLHRIQTKNDKIIIIFLRRSDALGFKLKWIQ